MKHRKWLRTFFSSSLLCPKIANLSWAASLVRPSLLHLRFSKTSSMGMFSCIQKIHKLNPKQQSSNHEPPKSLKMCQIYYQIHSFLQHCLQNFRLVPHLSPYIFFPSPPNKLQITTPHRTSTKQLKTQTVTRNQAAPSRKRLNFEDGFRPREENEKHPPTPNQKTEEEEEQPLQPVVVAGEGVTVHSLSLFVNFLQIFKNSSLFQKQHLLSTTCTHAEKDCTFLAFGFKKEKSLFSISLNFCPNFIIFRFK